MTAAAGGRWRYLLLKACARLQLAAGKRAAALATFARMLQIKPADGYALASQAHLQMQLNQVDAAIASLQRLTESAAPVANDAACWFNLGYALAHAQRTDEAVSAFRAAVARDPALDRAWYGLALALMTLRKFHDAAQALEKNTVLQPLSPHGWYRLAQVWLALGERDKALAVLARLRTFEPRVAAQLARENEALREPPLNMTGRQARALGANPIARLGEVRDAAH